MADGIGLSVGATNLTAVVVGRAAVTRSPVVTLFPHRPPEVGLPGENPKLNPDERGLVIGDFVDRVGDPVGIVASDGSVHRAEVLLADALRAMVYAVTNGRPPAGPFAVTYPAHWRPATVEALRNALSAIPEFGGRTPALLIPDATAALTALQNDPGLPARGVVALCDFGGSGTSITLVDAANGNEPVGPTVRHTELSGDLIDQALLTHVMNGLSEAGSIDMASTSAIGSLRRLRGQCRGAKERLSTTAVTSLIAELPGYRGDVRLTRNELDDEIREPVNDFVGVLQETVDRSGIRNGDLVAVASAGGGARIPMVTTTLSEHFRVPVVTTPQPELTAAIGGGLKAVRGTTDEGMTALAAAAPVTAAAAALAAADPGEMEGSTTFRALAWSEADHIPDVAPTDPYDYQGMADTDAVAGPRPEMQFAEYQTVEETPPQRRTPAVVLAAGVIALLVALVAAWWFLLRDDSTPGPASTTGPAPAPPASTTTAAPPPPPTSEVPPPPPPYTPPPATRTVTRTPQTATQTQAPPPPPPTSEAPPPPPPTSEPPPPPPPTSAPPPTQPPTLTIIPGLPGIPLGPQPAP